MKICKMLWQMSLLMKQRYVKLLECLPETDWSFVFYDSESRKEGRCWLRRRIRQVKTKRSTNCLHKSFTPAEFVPFVAQVNRFIDLHNFHPHSDRLSPPLPLSQSSSCVWYLVQAWTVYPRFGKATSSLPPVSAAVRYVFDDPNMRVSQCWPPRARDMSTRTYPMIASTQIFSVW